MFDEVTAGQQRRNDQKAMALARDTLTISKELIWTGQWIQDTRGGLTTSPQTEGFWSNSNITAANTMPPKEGCSRTLDDASSPGSKNTDALLGSMTYVGGVNYAKYRRKASRTKAFGKHEKVRPPTLCMQDELDRDKAQWPLYCILATIIDVSRRGWSHSSQNSHLTGWSGGATSLGAPGGYSCRMQWTAQGDYCWARSYAKLCWGEPEGNQPTTYCAVCKSGCYGISPGRDEGPNPSTRATHGSVHGWAQHEHAHAELCNP